jgi:hypothetical protein
MRLSNSRTISDIEFVIRAPSPGSDITEWKAHGADCAREIHRYVGQTYSFYFEILHVQLAAPSRKPWQIVVIKEHWHFFQSKADQRLTKSLKIIHGKQADILDWMRLHRDASAPKAKEVA